MTTSGLTDGVLMLLLECLLKSDQDFEVSYLDDVFLFRRGDVQRLVVLNSATFERANNLSAQFVTNCVEHPLGWNIDDVCLGVPSLPTKVRLGFLRNNDPVLGVLTGSVEPLSRFLDAMHRRTFGDA